MKRYIKPLIIEEIIEIEDIVAESNDDTHPGEGGTGELGDGKV